MNTCEACLYCVGNDFVGRECRRYPPAYNGVALACWPIVRPDDWCGEFVREQNPRRTQKGASMTRTELLARGGQPR